VLADLLALSLACAAVRARSNGCAPECGVCHFASFGVRGFICEIAILRKRLPKVPKIKKKF
jgi:hypothetical protein